MSGCCISFRGCRGRYVSGTLSRRTGRSESSQAGRPSFTWIYGQLSSLSAGRCEPAPLVQCRCAPRPSSGHAILPDLPRTELQFWRSSGLVCTCPCSAAGGGHGVSNLLRARRRAGPSVFCHPPFGGRGRASGDGAG